MAATWVEASGGQYVLCVAWPGPYYRNRWGPIRTVELVLVIRAHPRIILIHDDIVAPVFVDFVAQLYGDIDRLKYPPLCTTAR
jgi:hypothetical protein